MTNMTQNCMTSMTEHHMTNMTETDLKMTLRAGRLTPAAKVDVAHSTEMAPDLYAFSTSSRSSDVKPAVTSAVWLTGDHSRLHPVLNEWAPDLHAFSSSSPSSDVQPAATGPNGLIHDYSRLHIATKLAPDLYAFSSSSGF